MACGQVAETPLNHQAACDLLVQLPGLIIVKDLSSRILTLNSHVARLLRVQSLQKARGCYEHELAKCLQGASDVFVAQDQQTLETRSGRFLDVLTYPDGVARVVLAQKSCLCDSQGAPWAVLFQGIVLNDRLFGSVQATLEQHVHQGVNHGSRPVSYSLDQPAAQRPLSRRQQECLFFLLRGQTAKGIAKALHLSPRTVEGYLDQLKGCFGALTRTDVIERALHEGYGNFIPETLLACAA